MPRVGRQIVVPDDSFGGRSRFPFDGRDLVAFCAMMDQRLQGAVPRAAGPMSSARTPGDHVHRSGWEAAERQGLGSSDRSLTSSAGPIEPGAPRS